MDISDYIVTRVNGTQNTYDVWHDGMDEPYRTVMIPRVCNCPHYVYRLRHRGGSCKHHRIIEAKLNKNAVL